MAAKAAAARWRRLLDRFLRTTYAHVVSVELLAWGSVGLLLSCVLYFLSPLLDDDYHFYQRYLPWVYYLDWGQYDSFIVDHVVVFLAISLPMGWLLLFHVAYSGFSSRMDLALLVLRIACCLTVSFSLTVILTDFLSRRVMIACISLGYGSCGLVYSWSVPVWRWYLDEASSKGLVTLLPESVQEMLLNTSLIEWLSDTSFTDQFQQYLPFLLPLSKAEQLRLLEQLPKESQEVMTRPGLMPLLPTSVQTLLRPTEEADEDANDDAQKTITEFKSEPIVPIKPLALPSTATAGFDLHRPEVRNRGLSLQTPEAVLNDIITQRIWKSATSLVKTPSPQTLNRTAAMSSALFVLQLYASRRSRQAFISVIQFIVASSLGSVAACTILLRMAQVLNTSLTGRSVPMLRYVHQYLLRNGNSAGQNGQLANEADPAQKTAKTVQRVATSASAVVAVLYVLRKLRN